MMTKQKRKTNCRRTRQTENIARTLRAEFPDADIDVYRYSSVAVRMRVISEQFEGVEFSRRNAAVRKVLESLSERDQLDMLLPFVFTPAEIAAQKPLNFEYENPTPTLW